MDDEKKKILIERIKEAKDRLGLTEVEATKSFSNFIEFMSLNEKQTDFQMELLKIFNEVLR